MLPPDVVHHAYTFFVELLESAPVKVRITDGRVGLDCFANSLDISPVMLSLETVFSVGSQSLSKQENDKATGDAGSNGIPQSTQRLFNFFTHLISGIVGALTYMIGARMLANSIIRTNSLCHLMTFIEKTKPNFVAL
jgi:hypothetical protein